MSLQLILTPLAPVAAQSASDSFKENEGNKSSDYYASQILTLATSCLGANILVSCVAGSMQPSIYVYMLGSVVHIGKEILGAQAINESHKKRASDLKMLKEKLVNAAGSGELQRKTLETARDEEKLTLEFLKSRRSWLTVIAGAYWAAAGLAALEIVLEIPPPLGPGKTSIAGCSPNFIPALTTGLAVAGAYGALNMTAADGTAMKIATPLVALPMVIKSVGGVVTSAYNQAIPRLITFGASAGLVTWLAVEMGRRESQIEKNIQDLDAVLASMGPETPGNKEGLVEDSATGNTLSETVGNGSLGGGSNYSGGNTQTAQNDSRLCGVPGSGGLTFGKCADTTTPTKVNRPKFEVGMGAGPLLDFSNALSSAVDEIMNGTGGSATTAAPEGLVNQANNMRKVAESLQAKVNEKLKEAGKKPVDFKSEIESQMLAQREAYNSAAGQSSGPLASGNATLDTKIDADEKKSVSSETRLPTPDGDKVQALPFTLAGLGEAEQGSSTKAVDPTQSLGQSLEKFESAESDINNDPDISIFALISNRYVHNYGKVMRKKEVPRDVIRP